RGGDRLLALPKRRVEEDARGYEQGRRRPAFADHHRLRDKAHRLPGRCHEQNSVSRATSAARDGLAIVLNVDCAWRTSSSKRTIFSGRAPVVQSQALLTVQGAMR